MNTVLLLVCLLCFSYGTSGQSIDLTLYGISRQSIDLAFYVVKIAKRTHRLPSSFFSSSFLRCKKRLQVHLYTSHPILPAEPLAAWQESRSSLSESGVWTLSAGPLIAGGASALPRGCAATPRLLPFSCSSNCLDYRADSCLCTVSAIPFFSVSMCSSFCLSVLFRMSLSLPVCSSSPLLARAGCKKASCQICYSFKIKFIHSFSVCLSFCLHGWDFSGYSQCWRFGFLSESNENGV